MDKISNQFLAVNDVYCGDSTKLLSLIEPDSIALSVWSPPYHVGKKYGNSVNHHSVCVYTENHDVIYEE